ncbi:MAG: hypothetical protein AAF962_20560 [Actinomycetota bacterium]
MFEQFVARHITVGRLVAVGVMAITAATLWYQLNKPVVTPALVTIESGAPDAYDVPLATPVLIDDSRDQDRVVGLLHKPHSDQVAALDLRQNFALVTTTTVCADYLRRSELTINDGDWWVGRRPGNDDISDFYNLCEEELVDFHIFEIDRMYIDAFSDLPTARIRAEALSSPVDS